MSRLPYITDLERINAEIFEYKIEVPAPLDYYCQKPLRRPRLWLKILHLYFPVFAERLRENEIGVS